MCTGAILAGGRARLNRVVDGAIIIANEADRIVSSGVRVSADLVPDGGAFGALYTAVHAAPSIFGLRVREIGPDELQVFGPEEVLFFNLDTPDDVVRAIDLDGEYHYPS